MESFGVCEFLRDVECFVCFVEPHLPWIPGGAQNSEKSGEHNLM